MANLIKVAVFWSGLGAKIMVENCLCSNELKDQLLTYAAKLIDVGYAEGVDILFKAKLKEENAEEFPFYEEGNIDGDIYVHEQVAALQSSILDFNFLNYLEANLGLPVQEIVNVFRYAYSNQDKWSYQIQGVLN